MTDIFMTALNMSVTAAFVIAALCAARLVLQKIRAPKWISYLLWTVAGFRLAAPFTLESVLSLIPGRIPEVTLPDMLIYDGQPVAPGVISDVGGRYVESGYSYAVVWNFKDIVAYVWLAGILIMLLYAVISYVRLIRRKDSVTTPFVYGFFKPKIHIPGGLAGEELRYVTLHERTHIKRRDHLVKLFAFALLCVHWFNPLAWVAFVLLCADMEMSCDERVLRELGTDAKADYSQTLLSLSMNRRILSASPLAFGEGGVKGRIKNVLNFKKRSRVIIIAAVALAAVLSVGFAVNRATPPSEPAQELVNKPEEQPVSDSRALTAADIEEISAGTPRPRVLEQLGEPHGTLSGLFGDIYRLEDGRTAIIYYDNSGARVESTKIIAAPIPIVTLYEYSGDISSPLGASLERDGSGWVPLTGTVMVAIDVPDGTAAYRLYCAQTGTEVEPIPLRSVDYHVSDDNPNQTPDIRSPDLFKWNVSEAFPDSFLGHIWAVAADADGAETASSYVNAIYQSSGEEEKNAITQAIFDSLRYYSNGETEGLTFTVSSALDPFPVRLEARIKPWKGPQVSTDEYDALKELSRSRGPDAAPVIVQYGIPFGSPSGTANIQSATLYIEFADGAGREYPLLYDEFLRLKALAADAEGGGIQPIA